MSLNLKKQVEFKPQILNAREFAFDNVIVGGMGGSALAARIIFFLDPASPVWLHDDYGLPASPNRGEPEKSEGRTLYAAVSYSGDTAETLSFARKALEEKRSLMIITSGGALLEMAKEKSVPHILVPSGFQARDAVVYMLRALLYAINRQDLLTELEKAAVDFEKAFADGLFASKELEKKIPLIYASRENQILSYSWKIMLNETGKVPAFANCFPEVAHNEAQGIMPETAGSLAKHLKILLLSDREDKEEVRHGMEVFSKLAVSQGVEVYPLGLPSGKANKLLYTLAAARSAAVALAESRGIDPDRTLFIELFKKSL